MRKRAHTHTHTDIPKRDDKLVEHVKMLHDDVNVLARGVPRLMN